MKYLKCIVSLLVIVISTSQVWAQPGNPSNPVPLDGGTGLLMAVGAAYSIRKYRQEKKSRFR